MEKEKAGKRNWEQPDIEFNRKDFMVAMLSMFTDWKETIV